MGVGVGSLVAKRRRRYEEEEVKLRDVRLSSGLLG